MRVKNITKNRFLSFWYQLETSIGKKSIKKDDKLILGEKKALKKTHRETVCFGGCDGFLREKDNKEIFRSFSFPGARKTTEIVVFSPLFTLEKKGKK